MNTPYDFFLFPIQYIFLLLILFYCKYLVHQSYHLLYPLPFLLLFFYIHISSYLKDAFFHGEALLVVSSSAPAEADELHAALYISHEVEDGLGADDQVEWRGQSRTRVKVTHPQLGPCELPLLVSMVLCGRLKFSVCLRTYPRITVYLSTIVRVSIDF